MIINSTHTYYFLFPKYIIYSIQNILMFEKDARYSYWGMQMFHSVLLRKSNQVKETLVMVS